MKIKTMLIVTLMLSNILIMVSCSKDKIDHKKQSDIEYTVVEEADIPEELKNQIEEEKNEEFKISYSEEGYLYIATGYGKMSTGGYSIQVEELYLTNNAIIFDTTLLGPAEDELVLKAQTYPYIVVKTEFIEKNIVFE